MGPPARVKPEGVHAILAVDPGGTTGVAAGHYELLGSMKRTVTTGQRMHKTAEVKGDWLEQANTIVQLAVRWAYTAQVEHHIPADRLHVVFENYIPDPKRVGAGATDLSPVWVGAPAGAMIVNELGLDVVWQTASEAKGYATNERLKQWGLWVVGSAHERDANRHLAKLLDRLLVW